ncbi:beta-galactosidase [Paenibacillus urinalis]|uniref:Beta-galactosidase n=1 Tax=Paenibacillus urinalis TaxID=521520 RepID=A0AAX3N5M5_9BACL|nr:MULTISPECIES: beta-galactosidase [Paenibacillus]WDH84429.1 beta-galactosidase [Paenibacillus urinalis]WDH95898.1 beta-galactosidase [Paenibacillus urinalis]WDI04113.1 beta-galactosidase [Paenibacillus urinalis]GAK38572.1 beta-galactosidase [Paenibacillus sp. TCA20]
MISTKLPKMFYGGDYNPEQWDQATHQEDLRMFKLAGIDIATINVFSWAKNQPDEITYNFGWLDELIDSLYESGVYVCLATSTGAHPAWMATKYPDVLRVDKDGRKRKFGGRHNSCPNSPTYRLYSERIADKLAERYKDHPAVLVWHVSNEYGGDCYCDNCERAFRVWLKEKYQTLDQLNRAWNTAFWGHTFYDWDEIVLPSNLSEEWGDRSTNFQGISLDYSRFNSDSMLNCYKLEYDAIKRHVPESVVTTNLMGFFKQLDYFKWAKYMDIISWDSYPSLTTPPSETAMANDLMRGLKDGMPFMLMEQTPSQQNWQPYNSLKRPGVMRLQSYQTVAHGADTVMFFQLRRSIGACEKYHGAVIEHVGHENTRVFREVAQLGKELQRIGDRLLDSRADAKAAIVFDWDNWWAIEKSSGPTIALNYVQQIHKYYASFYNRNVQVDMVSVDTDLSAYDLVVAPVLYMVKPGFAEKLEAFVENGGTFLTTFFSGIVNENDLVTVGGYPGELRKMLGIWVEEIDALFPDQKNKIVLKDKFGKLQGSYECGMLCDLLHTEGAEVIAEYGEDFYKGMPAVTRNTFGKGEAYYVATDPEQGFLDELIEKITTDKGIHPNLSAPSGVEVSRRVKDGISYLFVLNHNTEAVSYDLGQLEAEDLISGSQLSGMVSIEGRDVQILEVK